MFEVRGLPAGEVVMEQVVEIVIKHVFVGVKLKFGTGVVSNVFGGSQAQVDFQTLWVLSVDNGRSSGFVVRNLEYFGSLQQVDVAL